MDIYLRHNMFQPIIKWSGSKRTQAKKIVNYFPKNIEFYYEPFLGGGSVLRELLDNTDIKVKHYICSDINAGLIELWQYIQKFPAIVFDGYDIMWNEMNSISDINKKKEYFYYIRERYNQEHHPVDLFFIMRTTTNGMPRYNKNGDFNNSFHFSRKGIEPIRLKKILYEWHEKIQPVSFISCSYEHIQSGYNDIVYLDPPYFNTKGMYYGTIDYDRFFTWMRKQRGKYILSFDGKIIDKEDMTYAVPKDLYSEHVYLKSGKSSFRRIIGKGDDFMVHESLYIK